jgi:hypothetical protein
MAGYIDWLASQYATVRKQMRDDLAALREEAAQAAGEGQHRRIPEMAAQYIMGVKNFVKYAHDCGALTKAETTALLDRSKQILLEVTRAQSESHRAVEPHVRYVELLRAALLARRGHLAALDGLRPPDAEVCGWQGSKPKGDRIGWVDGDDVYLIPDVAYAIAQRMAREQGTMLAVSEHTLRRRLYEHGLLASVEATANKVRYTSRHMIKGVRMAVLHVKRETLLPGKGAPSAPGAPDPPFAMVEPIDDPAEREAIQEEGRTDVQDVMSLPPCPAAPAPEPSPTKEATP